MANESVQPYVLYLQDKTRWEIGLTKREFFALEAMRVFIRGIVVNSPEDRELAARMAVHQADCLIAELERL